MNGSFLLIVCLTWVLFMSQRASSLLFNKRFSFFRPRQDSQILSYRVRRLEIQVRNLQSEYDQLLQRVQSLENSDSPGCPSTAPGNSVVLDGFCYSFESIQTSFTDAQTDCSGKGGKLAEPSLTNDNFYQQIRSSFSTASSASQIYLGITGETTSGNYVYASPGGAQIPTTDPRWDSVPPTASDQLAGILEPVGTDWRLSTSTKTVQLPYICQFATV